MRTIPGISKQLTKLDEPISTVFLPSITNGIVINPSERKLLSLPPKLGGLGIPIFSEICQFEYENSIKLTKPLCTSIINQNRQTNSDDQNDNIKNKIHIDRIKRNNETLEKLRASMSEKQLRLNDLNKEKGASSWLTTLPIKSEGYSIHKQLFWDLIRI